MRCGGCAGSGRGLRLDPFGLPVRFSASDAAADGRVRDIELHPERGVLPLFMTSHAGEAVAEWRAWSEVLGVRLLLAEPSVSSRTADAQLGELHVERPRPRRRRRSALKARRPTI